MLFLTLMKSRSEWQHMRRGLSHALRSCRRNWKQGWTRLESRSCGRESATAFPAIGLAPIMERGNYTDILMGTSLTHLLPFPWMSASIHMISARGISTKSAPYG
jgi:hypothetical protein